MKKNYLCYGEVLEGSGWINRTDMESIKNEWSFSKRIFEVPEDFDFEAFKKLDKPRYQGVCKLYPLIFEEGSLIHVKGCT